MRNSSGKLIAFAVVAFLLMLFAAMMWKGNNDYYVNSYKPVIKESQERKKLAKQKLEQEDEKNTEPRAAGMREKDIKMVEGYRSRSY